jgi:sugar-specific transcriptional regulator TrmB
MQSNLENDYLQKLLVDLTSYGLSSSQARLYLFLLGKPPIPAGRISQKLNMHRVEVYRKLRELAEIGAVQVYLDSPKKFAAVNPKTVLKSLVNRMELRILSLKDSTDPLEGRLKIYETSQNMRNLTDASIQGVNNYYKFGKGREGYFRELRRTIEGAKSEVLIITSTNGIARAYLNGFHDVYRHAAKRGVCVRMVGEINRDNLKLAKRFAKVLELRHIAEVGFRFTVIDQSIAIISTNFDDSNLGSKSDSDSFFFFNDATMGSAWRFLFYHLWDDAIAYDVHAKGLGSIEG